VDADGLALATFETSGTMIAEGLGLAEMETSALGLAVGRADSEGSSALAMGLADGVTGMDGLSEMDGLAEVDGDADAEKDVLGDADAEKDVLGDADAEKDVLGDADAEKDVLGDAEAGRDVLGEGDGELDLDGDGESDAPRGRTAILTDEVVKWGPCQIWKFTLWGCPPVLATFPLVKFTSNCIVSRFVSTTLNVPPVNGSKVTARKLPSGSADAATFANSMMNLPTLPPWTTYRMSTEMDATSSGYTVLSEHPSWKLVYGLNRVLFSNDHTSYRQTLSRVPSSLLQV
jgi:hypothetical protein